MPTSKGQALFYNCSIDDIDAIIRSLNIEKYTIIDFGYGGLRGRNFFKIKWDSWLKTVFSPNAIKRIQYIGSSVGSIFLGTCLLTLCGFTDLREIVEKVLNDIDERVDIPVASLKTLDMVNMIQIKIFKELNKRLSPETKRITIYEVAKKLGMKHIPYFLTWNLLGFISGNGLKPLDGNTPIFKAMEISSRVAFSDPGWAAYLNKWKLRYNSQLPFTSKCITFSVTEEYRCPIDVSSDYILIQSDYYLTYS